MIFPVKLTRGLLFTLATLSASAAIASPEPVVTPLMTKPLPDLPGKEVLVLLVEFPPGGVDPVHRHDAHGFIYVVEGSIVMGVRGAAEVTLSEGETFYEGPDDIHTIGRNASSTQPAKFLVHLVKSTGVPPVLPAE